MKKIMAIFLVLILIVSLVGCGKKKREIIQLTLSTEDSEAILKAAGIALPDIEEAKGANSVVKWFAWWDDFHNYRDDEIVQTGFWTFQQKYNSDVEWVECTWSDRFTGLATLTLSDDIPDFASNDMVYFPYNTMKGMFQPVDDYVNYDDPLWRDMKDFAYNYVSLNGKAYMFVTDITYGNVVVYNRRVISEWGFDDPTELYFNDEWTWDKFQEMCYDFSDADADRYALDSWSCSSGMMHSTGVPIIEYDTETKQYISNADNPALERAATLLYDINKNDCIYPWWSHNWSLRGSEGEGLNTGLLLFFIGHDYTFTGPVDTISPIFGDIEQGEFMYCPLPRDPNGDGLYYTESIASGYFLVKGSKNPEGVALLASCQRFKVIDPTVIGVDKKQKRDTYKWPEEMLDMYDTMHDLANGNRMIVTGYGYTNGLGDCISAFEDNGHVMEAKTWAQIKEAQNDKLTYYLEDFNNMLEKYNNGEDITA